MKRVEELIREAQSSMYEIQVCDNIDLPYRFNQVQKVQKVQK